MFIYTINFTLSKLNKDLSPKFITKKIPQGQIGLIYTTHLFKLTTTIIHIVVFAGQFIHYLSLCVEKKKLMMKLKVIKSN